MIGRASSSRHVVVTTAVTERSGRYRLDAFRESDAMFWYAPYAVSGFQSAASSVVCREISASQPPDRVQIFTFCFFPNQKHRTVSDLVILTGFCGPFCIVTIRAQVRLDLVFLYFRRIICLYQIVFGTVVKDGNTSYLVLTIFKSDTVYFPTQL